MQAPTIAACLFLALIAQACRAQEDDEDNPFHAGLVATYSQERQVIKRIETAPALHWQKVPPDVRFEPGKVDVVWQGRLLTQGADEYRLHVYVAGDVTIRLADKVVLERSSDAPRWVSSEPLKLEHDYHPLEIKYTGAGDEKRLRLFWSSTAFALEPVPARQLYHEVEQASPSAFEQGQQVARGLRCAACHEMPGEEQPLASPALDHLSGNLKRPWLERYLLEGHGTHGKLTKSETTDLVEYLLKSKADEEPAAAPGNVKTGRRIFETVGCLACHRVGEQGTGGLMSGGDLTRIGDKRPIEFFNRWLASPSELNSDHRMPTYELSAGERMHLAAYLGSLSAGDLPPGADPFCASCETDEEAQVRGNDLFRKLQCASCHRNVAGREAGREARLRVPSKPECPQVDPLRPVDQAETKALATFLSEARKLPQQPRPASAPQILAERNCLNCHAREGAEGFAPKLLALAKADADLAPQVSALTPPSLLAVGDKLNDTVLLAMIKRMEQPHRDYLQVRMPRYSFTQEELETLLAYFINYDRIPPEPPDERARSPQDLPKEKELADAGQKLVIAGSGFGCTSCHAIGKFLPSKAPINARGPNLTNIGFRIREPYFYRWCKNPARIVPGQEMPAVSVPVKGVLKDNVNHQLAAVWTILNTPGFEPKDAAPVRVFQQGFATDIVVADGVKYLNALTIAFENRHNVLYDLESGRVVRWWRGDCMTQHTEGKTWVWKAAGEDLLRAGFITPELTLLVDGKELSPAKINGNVCELIGWNLEQGNPWFQCRMTFAAKDGDPLTVSVRHEFAKDGPFEDDKKTTGWQHFVRVKGLPEGAVVRMRVLDEKRMERAVLNEQRPSDLKLDGMTLRAVDRAASEGFVGGFELLDWQKDGSLLSRAAGKEGVAGLSLLHHSHVQLDDARVFQEEVAAPEWGLHLGWESLDYAPAEPPRDAEQYTANQLVPGLPAFRLDVPPELLMPTAFAWQPAGDLLVTSLKGDTFKFYGWTAQPSYGTWQRVTADLAVPYGIQGRDKDSFDVLHKKALLRVEGDRHLVAAAGWGYTDDYHDWAVGLVSDGANGYFLALPCQQDKRLEATAKYRGNVLRLTPRKQTPDNRQLFDIAPVSSGHRFPMGIARNRAGDVFVTDNQGNYNPFNELNHVQKGKHFGFINAIDKNKPKPATTPPALNIPHPWTRSVNGICFLETPEHVREKEKDLWGAFEGHLIGCEYDTRRLIRMSLQKVGDTYQGACYPFSREKPKGENFLGPISCAISPRGELYIGSIRDSGWGGGANVGEIVRIDPPGKEKLPPGIAEVRAHSKGFNISFTQPVDRKLAGDVKNYSIESFTRESTPAYGGPDKERRAEKIGAIEVAKDGLSVSLKLPEMRTEYVYEFHLRPLHAEEFFPAEAYYTLNFLPE